MIATGLELLIFDLDGVLVDSSPAHAKAFIDLWRRIGISGPAYPEIAGRTTKEVVSEYTSGLTPSAVQLEEWIHFKQLRAREYLAQHCILYDDTIPSLQPLTGPSRRLALGTSASGETTRWILKQFDLTKYFSAIATAEDVQTGKPSPEIYLHVMSIAGTSPEVTLIIEDSFSGLQAASATGAFVASTRSGLEIDGERFAGSFATIEEMIDKLGLDQ